MTRQLPIEERPSYKMTTLPVPQALANYQDRYRTDLVEGAYRHEIASLVGHAAAMVMVLLFLGDHLPYWMHWSWPSALAAATLIRGVLWSQHRRRPKSEYRDRHVIHHALGVSTSALAWSIGFHGALPYLDLPSVAELVMVFAGIGAGAVITLSSRVETYVMFTGLMLGPPTVTLLRSGVPSFVEIGIMATFFLLFCGFGVRNANRLTRSGLLRRYQNDDYLLDLATAKAELEDAWNRSEQANEAKRQFLANISHEVRTPLNGILGMTDLVLETNLQSQQRTQMQTLKRCGKNLLALVDDLLDLSRIESGRMDVEQVNFDLRGLAEELVAVHAVQAREKTEVAVRLDWDENLPEEIAGDPVRVRQILHNLIGNALKFTEKGEVRLVVRSQKQKEGERLLLQVQDTGIGIPEARQDAIFESFTQVDGTTTRKYGGTGLGLSICRNLAGLMGGSISVSSTIGTGSVFSVDLPLCHEQPSLSHAEVQVLLAGDFGELAAQLSGFGWDVATAPFDSELWQESRKLFHEDAPTRAIVCSAKSFAGATELLDALQRNTECTLVRAFAKRPPRRRGRNHERNLLDWNRSTGAGGLRALLAPIEAQGSGPLNQLDVLLAEDDRTNAHLVVHHLEREGHTVRVAKDGEEAVRLFEERRPDLILMDCQMPNLDGPSATRRIRALPNGKRVPIVALSANDSPADCEQFLAAGMDGCLSKPFTRSTLQRSLQVVEDVRAAAAPQQEN